MVFPSPIAPVSSMLISFAEIAFDIARKITRKRHEETDVCMIKFLNKPIAGKPHHFL
jgi:hypothetical protein